MCPIYVFLHAVALKCCQNLRKYCQHVSLYVSLCAVALRNISKVMSVEGELHLLSRQGVALLVIGVCVCVRAYVCACVRACVRVYVQTHTHV